jgi:hypothetical protein
MHQYSSGSTVSNRIQPLGLTSDYHLRAVKLLDNDFESCVWRVGSVGVTNNDGMTVLGIHGASRLKL